MLHLNVVRRSLVVVTIIILINVSLFSIATAYDTLDTGVKAQAAGPWPLAPDPANSDVKAESRSGSRAQDLLFHEASSGLFSSGSFNYVMLGDFNSDNEYDIVFSATDGSGVPDATKSGLYAYTGNGAGTWTNASAGLWRRNSFAGLAMADADADGYMEIYATDDNSGYSNNSGVKVFEYRSGTWTDSVAHVKTPLRSGICFNVVVTNVSGDERPDMVVSNSSGMKYFENQGGNPVIWRDKSTGLPTSQMYTALAVEDMNKDGLNDIVSCDYNGNEHLFIQNTTSGFQWSDYSSAVEITGRFLGVDVGDVNSDSNMDIIYGAHSGVNGLRCILGNGGGVSGTSFSFTGASTGLPTTDRYYGMKIVDIDLDGDNDCVAVDSSGNDGIEIYLGNGSTLPGPNLGWTLASNTNLTSTGDWFTVDCADINHDGSYDIAACSWGSGVKAYLNNITTDVTVPGSITNLSVTNVTTTTITVNWTAPADNGTDAGSGPVKGYDLRYSTSTLDLGSWASATQVNDEPTPASPGSPEHYNLTGLQPGTLYYIGLRHWDERPNYSPLSNIVQASTLGIPDTTPPAGINDLAAIEPTNNTINLTWTAPADNGTDPGSGPVAEYDIRYHTVSITDINWPSAAKATAPMTPSMPSSTEYYTVGALEDNTTYYFAVKSRDEKSNWSPLSNIASGKTLADPDVTAPFGVNDLAAVEPTNSSINLTWTAVGDDGNTGQAVLYDLRYSTSTINDANFAGALQVTGVPVPQSAGNTEHFTVSGLDPDTTYYFGIKVRDEMLHWSPLSNIAHNTTLADIQPDTTPPGRITDLATTTPTTTTITLTWTAPGVDGNTGQATGYDIRYSETLIADQNWVSATAVTSPPVPKGPGQTETFVVFGLSADTTYFFGIKAADEGPRWSELSNIAIGTTLDETAPPVPLPELSIRLSAAKTVLNSSETVDLEILVRNLPNLTAVAMVTVNISSANPDVGIEPATGLTGADGIMTAVIGAPVVSAELDITVDVSISKAGFKSNGSSMTFTVNPTSEELRFNLRVTDKDITFNRTEIRDGDAVTISANITNTGNRFAGPFVVRIFVGDTQLGAEKSVGLLRVAGAITVEAKWSANEGQHTIRVDVVASNASMESDLADNSAERKITVLKKDVPDVPDGPGPGDEQDTDSDEKSSSAGMMLGLIILIIIILIVLYVVTRRKRPAEPLPPPPPPPPPYYAVGEETRDESRETSATAEGYAEPIEQLPPTGEAIYVSWETLDGTPPMAMPADETPEPEDSGQEATGSTDHGSRAPDTGEDPEPSADSLPPTADSQLSTDQLVACPTCGSQIAALTTPCPHCNTTLNWS